MSTCTKASERSITVFIMQVGKQRLGEVKQPTPGYNVK